MGGRNQFLGVRSFLVFEARLERVRRLSEHAGVGGESAITCASCAAPHCLGLANHACCSSRSLVAGVSRRAIVSDVPARVACAAGKRLELDLPHAQARQTAPPWLRTLRLTDGLLLTDGRRRRSDRILRTGEPG